jgi:uracil-DNA glycosylase
VQRYGKEGGIDWDLNVDPEDIVEPSKTGQPIDPKDKTETKDGAKAKENEAPLQDLKSEQDKTFRDTASENAADPEAEIDSDEEAALREAGI